MLFERNELRNLVISVLVVSTAFTFQNISVDFFIKCFLVVSLSYLAHHFFHAYIAGSEGILSKCDFWPAGTLITLASGILSGGIAVLPIPSALKLKDSEAARWRKGWRRLNVLDVGLPSIGGPLFNLLIGSAFFSLFMYFGSAFLRLGALINFWMCLANLIPFPPLDGARIMVWDRWVWLLIVIAPSVGLLGLFI